jgi:hypothetical protein
MTYSEFEAVAEREWERIPDTFKEGIDALVIERDAKSHPSSPDVYTLGECMTEAFPSEFDGPDTIRSDLILYYGSFRRLAAVDPSFDWEAELWETLTHELKHHLESLADEDDLEELDVAMDHHFRRHDGAPFDPYYYRGGEPVGDGWYRLEHAYFHEVEATADPRLSFTWAGRRYSVANPDIDTDVTFVTLDEVHDAPGELVVVVVRRQSFAERVRALARKQGPTVSERVGRADPE